MEYAPTEPDRSQWTAPPVESEGHPDYPRKKVQYEPPTTFDINCSHKLNYVRTGQQSAKPNQTSDVMIAETQPPSGHLGSNGLESDQMFVTQASRWGAQFALYAADPIRFHSLFVMRTHRAEKETRALELAHTARAAHGSRKLWAMRSIDADGAETALSMEWTGI